MLVIIQILLAISAAYFGGMWLWMAGLSVFRRAQYDFPTLIEIERQTFHLGLCFILSAGFLGLIAGAN